MLQVFIRMDMIEVGVAFGRGSEPQKPANIPLPDL